MRLFEVADHFVDELETVLRNRIGRADSEEAAEVLSYPALSNLLMGYGEISYPQFDQIVNNNPGLQSLIQDYNEEKVILKTKKQLEQPAGDLAQPQTSPSVDQMASQGAKQHLQQISK